MKIEKRLTEIEPPRILNQSETWSEIVNGSVESLQSESELQGRHHFETLQSALGLQGRLGSLRPELELQGQFETGFHNFGALQSHLQHWSYLWLVDVETRE